MHNSCVLCYTHIVRHILFLRVNSMSIIAHLRSVRGVCCHRHAKEKLFLFRMARKFNYIPFEKETKNVFFLAHITWELDDSDDDDHESEWNFSFSRSIFYAKSPLFHESCPRLILWDTSFHSFAQRRLHELCIKISNWF